ncbi:Uncharacterized protein HZ326_31727 [Fusarium oxysporum f. sp. albedinis]|nr:Uncharacterized protein HZ326_31727 [Fusarium oxysporum f. sp. albedinis]
MSCAYLSPSDAAFPPKKNDRFPILVREHFSMSSRSVVHLTHRNRKMLNCLRCLIRFARIRFRCTDPAQKAV